jgi:glycosyltransferase involved in cell wall biosynthesis
VANDLAETTGIQRDKIKVVYNPVVSSELFSKSEEPLDHPWFSSGEPPVVLAVGRLTEAKDFPVLIRAFALVRKERPARLIILGEGAERPKLEALVRELGLNEDVIMPGFVDNPYKYMRNATVFVLSSAWEGFGVVLVEAMALGTAIVSTDCPNGPAEILEGGKWGDLVTVGDWRALASAILKRLEQPENERVKMATERAKEFRTESIVTDYFRYLYPNNMMSYDESKTKINEVDPCS